MDWSNEYWIKAYVKDSPSFATCSWQAKGMFFLLARKFNAAGMLPLEKGDPSTSIEAICEAVGGPWEEIRGPLLELIRTKTVSLEENWAYIKSHNFVEAQRAKWGDNARKRAYRHRQKADQEAKEIEFKAKDPDTLEAELPKPEPISAPDMLLDVPASTPTVEASTTCATLVVPESNPTLEHDPQGSVQGSDVGNQGSVQGSNVGVPKRDICLQGSVQGSDVGNQGSVQGSNVGVPKRDICLQGSVQGSDVSTLPTVPKRDICLQGSGSYIGSLQPNVPKRDQMSHTDQKDRSRERVPSELLSSSPNRSSEETGSEDAQGSTQQQSLFKGESYGTTKKEREDAIVTRVWERYMGQWVKFKRAGPKPTLTPKRRGKILQRSKEFGVENVLIAVDRLFEAEWRIQSGYTLIDYAIKNTEQTEKILSTDPNAFGRRQSPHGGQHKRTKSYPIQQGGPNSSYKGQGVQLHSGEDGTIRDQNNNIVEISSDPLGLGIDFDEQSRKAKAEKAKASSRR